MLLKSGNCSSEGLNTLFKVTQSVDARTEHKSQNPAHYTIHERHEDAPSLTWSGMKNEGGRG